MRANITTVLVTLLLLVALAVAGIRWVRAREHKLKCQANLRELYGSIMNYAHDHQGQLPGGWEDVISHRFQAEQLRFLACPASDDPISLGPTTQTAVARLRSGGHLSYVYLGKGRTVKSLHRNDPLLYEPLSSHHDRSMSVLFADGRIELLSRERSLQFMQDLANKNRDIDASDRVQPSTRNGDSR